jgi:hypothetical protein
MDAGVPGLEETLGHLDNSRLGGLNLDEGA